LAVAQEVSMHRVQQELTAQADLAEVLLTVHTLTDVSQAQVTWAEDQTLQPTALPVVAAQEVQVMQIWPIIQAAMAE
jgi:hypothetical protein